jgi:hypothetical protein
MDDESEFAAARAAFAELTPESPSADFDARLRRRLAPAPARRWSLSDFFALTPAFAAAAAAGFALFRLGHMPPPRAGDVPAIEASAPGFDAGRWGYDPSASPCSTALDCG